MSSNIDFPDMSVVSDTRNLKMFFQSHFYYYNMKTDRLKNCNNGYLFKKNTVNLRIDFSKTLQNVNFTEFFPKKKIIKY